MTRYACVIAALALVACGKKDDKGGSGGGGGAPAKEIDLAKINSVIPAALKDKIVFEKRDLVEDRGRKKPTFTMAAPKGWTQDMPAMASLKPPKEPDLGFMTSLSVSSNCDGTCEPKDWAATSDKVNFEQFKSNGTHIEKEQKGKNDHLVVAASDDKRYVVYAWWEDGARRYHYCSATLDKVIMDAAPAFELACKAVSVANDD